MAQLRQGWLDLVGSVSQSCFRPYFSRQKINETDLLSAATVPAKAPLPEYCRVLGYLRPAINFEIRLPTKDWNGEFLAGCGGFCDSSTATT